MIMNKPASLVMRSGKRRADAWQVGAVAGIFKSLSDPTRLRILLRLAAGEACVHELCAALAMSQPAVSHQLQLLRAARLVNSRRDGREIFYSIKDAHVMSLVDSALAHASERE
jgi:DNA-binding transcriptional ArsR family regulator